MQVNVGGEIFRLTNEQLNNLPNSKLSKLHSERTGRSDDSKNATEDSVYYDRDPESFKCILSAYKGRLISVPKSICPAQLREEMLFWVVDETFLDVDACERLEMALVIVETIEKNVAEKMAQYSLAQRKIQILTKVTSWQDFCSNWKTVRLRLCSIVEDPSSSNLAKWWMLISIGFILISLCVFVVGTVPGYYDVDEDGIEHEIETLEQIEVVCMSWFTFEYAVRFVVAPKKFVFIRQFLNVIDLMSIIPFFVQIFTQSHGSHEAESAQANVETWKHLTQVIRILRVVRIFRLGRHSEGLKLLCITLVQSANELVMLSIYLFIGIIILATALFMMESEKTFPNLCEALWFAAVTITTVGYGDKAPLTIPGRIVTAFSFLLGLIAIAIPIHPIITNFSNCYMIKKDMDMAFKRTLKRMKYKEATGDGVEQQSDESSLASGSPFKDEEADKAHPATQQPLLPRASSESLRRRASTGTKSRLSIFRHSPLKRRWSTASGNKRSKMKSGLARSSILFIPVPSAGAQHEGHCRCIFCTD